MLLLYCVMSGLFLIVYFSLGSHATPSCAHKNPQLVKHWIQTGVLVVSVQIVFVILSECFYPPLSHCKYFCFIRSLIDSIHPV